MVAVDGLSLDMNPRRITHIYKWVRERISNVFPKVRVPKQLVGVFSKVRALPRINRILSKVTRTRQKRGKNDLGKVVGFATQEVYGTSQTNEIDDSEDVNGSESKRPS